LGDSEIPGRLIIKGRRGEVNFPCARLRTGRTRAKRSLKGKICLWFRERNTEWGTENRLAANLKVPR